MESIILVVEDCAESVPALEIALQKYFLCTIRHDVTGSAALAAFERQSHLMLAVITDLNLPDIDGWEIIRQLRRDPLGAKIPIIAISADPDPRAKIRAFEAGADSFFSKPYSPAEVCRCLEGILHDKDLHTKDKLDFTSSDNN